MALQSSPYSNAGRPADCSTAGTRRVLKGDFTPHELLMQKILNNEEVTQDTYRIYNGECYQARKNQASQPGRDLNIYYEVVNEQSLNTAVEYDTNLNLVPENCVQEELDFQDTTVTFPC